MEIKEFISNLNKKHFSLNVEKGRLNLTGDKNKLSKEEILAIRDNHGIIDFIKNNRNELIEYISSNSTPSEYKKTKDISAIYRLSGLQEGMLFHGLYNEQASYVGQFACDIFNVDLNTFQESWNYVLKQHSILRSAFYYDAFNIPVQSVHKEVKLPIEVYDCTAMNEADKALAVEEYEKADTLKGFDFKKPPLMRITFIRLTDTRYRMLWTTHHILSDGWSLPIIMEEFLSNYELLISGKPLKQKQEDLYEDYIRYIERKDKDRAKEYWTNYLSSVHQSTLLPFISNTSERTKGIGSYKSLYAETDVTTTARIQDFARSNGLTVNTIIQGVWSYLLHSYTASNNIVFGVIVSGRPDDLPFVEQRVGMYINALPLYACVPGEIEIVQWLKGIQNDQVKSRGHQYTPLHEVQRWTGIQGDFFDSLLVFENYPVSKVISQKQWSLQVDNVKINERTNYPFTILVNSAEQIHLHFNYNSELLHDQYAAQIRSHFEHVLLQLASNATKNLKDLRLLSSKEEQDLVNGLNNTAANYPQDKNLIDLFEEQVIKTPAATAVVFENYNLSYQQLNECSNQLAHYLISRGLKKETLVPICIERSIEMIVGVLGILKAGGTYVPVDPEYPVDRISYMLGDLRADIVISSKSSKSKLQDKSGVEIIELDTDWATISGQPVANPQVKRTPGYLAYVLYTSGSTGIPKGVEMPGSGLVNLLSWQEKQFDNDKRNVLQFASLNFDVSFQEIFSTLCFGNSLYLIAEDRRKDMSEMLRDISQNRISHLFIPYIVLQSLAEASLTSEEDVSSLRDIIVAGEQLKLTEDIQKFLDKNKTKLTNQYGPTEAHVVSSYTVTGNYKSNPLPPIGKPIDNIQLYILDANGRLCPKGVAGELCIGGVQVAQGYLNRPELTAEKFIKDPFSKEPGARLYKSGDLARWMPDDNLEYLGRIDEQVKIRGYRVELGEIESILQQSELVSQSVVLAKVDKSGNKQLVGYIIANETFDKVAVTAYLKSRLPEYMVPALWVEVESLPLSPNGKIDKKALSLLAVNEQAGVEYVAPRNETEQNLANIWQEVLGIQKVGTHDNFFEIGGHSILAMQVISSIRRKLKLEVGIKNLFVHPTIAGLSESLSGAEKTSPLPGITVVNPRPQYIPLSFGQERLWFIDKLEGSVAYHMSTVLRLKGDLNREALEHAIKMIVDRHEVLRTVIKEQEGEAYQQIVEVFQWKLDTVVAHDKNGQGDLQNQIQQLINRPFDLSKDYMLRADLVTEKNDEFVLVVTMHHIASDGWSLSVVVKEVVELYKSFINDSTPDLPWLQIQYADYALWQRRNIQGELLDKKLDYWRGKLAAVTPLQLPTDFPRSATQTTEGEITSFSINKNLLSGLNAISQQQGATLFMTLIAAFKVLFNRYTGQQDICVGTPTANRTHKEVEGLIGLFLNTLAIRSNVDENETFINLLQQVKATTLDAYNNQEVPFEKVVEAVVKERDISRNALFQVMFTLQNTPEVPKILLGNVELSSEAFVNKTSKFDLSFSITESPAGLHGSVLYNTGLFKKDTISRMLEHFNELLSAIIKEPQQKIGCLNILPKNQQKQILQEFNKTLSPLKTDKTLVELFEQQAATTPHNKALVFAKNNLTYQQLNGKANQLANYLKEQGVTKEFLVPICIDRTVEMMVGILAILKAGAAYVPVDPEYPSERIGYILSDTNAGIILTSSKYV
ncbi:MAG TPA: amino acid adenylation domain-containing protein [Segetibacter sp.]